MDTDSNVHGVMAQEKSKKAKSLWDHLKAITKDQKTDYWSTLTDEDRKSWSTFMIMRFLSMNPDWIQIINYLQPFVEKLDPPVVYELLIGVIPKSNVFLRYVKADSNKITYPDWLVDLVSKEYRCSNEQARDYIRILMSVNGGPEPIYKICSKYRVSEEKVNALDL